MSARYYYNINFIPLLCKERFCVQAHLNTAGNCLTYSLDTYSLQWLPPKLLEYVAFQVLIGYVHSHTGA